LRKCCAGTGQTKGFSPRIADVWAGCRRRTQPHLWVCISGGSERTWTWEPPRDRARSAGRGRPPRIRQRDHCCASAHSWPAPRCALRGVVCSAVVTEVPKRPIPMAVDAVRAWLRGPGLTPVLAYMDGIVDEGGPEDLARLAVGLTVLSGWLARRIERDI